MPLDLEPMLHLPGSGPRFPSNPLILRVPLFPTIGFNEGDPPNKKGKRVLLGSLGSILQDSAVRNEVASRAPSVAKAS